VRSYDTYIVAEARVTKPDMSSALNAGFVLIADYIFGNNTAAAPIAMTAPVGESPAMSENIAMTVPVGETQLGTDRVISFVMPSKYTLTTIPKPKNADVVLREVPAHRVAVLSFSWSASQKNVDAKKAALLEMVVRDGLEPQGPAEAKFYNPPWTPPFLLRNEIHIPVK
jgi:hypothetical protein